MAATSHDLEGRATGGQPSPPADFRCLACGYGAARRRPPERCPMCGGSRWQEQPQRRAAVDLPPPLQLRRQPAAEAER